jgi:peptidoglycan hydrolase-like protein with peptidoglycan-binding domain
MSHRFVGGGLAVFTCLTLALVINLTSLQKGTRELAPPPKATALASGPGERSGNGASSGLVVLNAPNTDQTAVAVRRELVALGYRPSANDGPMDTMTRAAIMAFEYDNGLPLTASADDVQLQRLLLGANETTPIRDAGRPVTPEARQVMVRVQQSLQQLDYQPGPVNGTFSAATERAIRRFEIDNKLRETGRISGVLIAGLATRTGTSKVKVSRR